jgi:endogenous inhibitor of DNA gyrase (YacG/DUF329 family)
MMIFDAEYANVNYDIDNVNNMITRKFDTPVEHEKHRCLKSMLKIFTGAKYDFKPADFIHIRGPIRNSTSRCICSQREQNITHHIIEHKETELQFKVGGDCFNRLFQIGCHQEILDFYKKPCKMCKKLIQKKSDDRPDFCTKKCKEMYDDIQRELDHKRWIIEIRLTKEARTADNEMTNLMKWEHVQFERLLKFNAL